MDTKLTLSLDKVVIQNAKAYAKAHNTSLSNLIESYLSVLMVEPNTKAEITPLVKSLIGVIDIPEDQDDNKSYREYLEDKYK